MQGSDNTQGDKPEPEEDINLLVENVHAEHAECIKRHEQSGASIFVERALGHAGEHLGHGVDAVFRVLAGELEDLKHEVWLYLVEMWTLQPLSIEVWLHLVGKKVKLTLGTSEIDVWLYLVKLT